MSTAFAPGKLILSGEHSVVYGYSALAMAVDRGITVTLDKRNGKTICPQADERLQQALSLVLPSHGLHVSFHSDLPIGRGMGSSAALSIAIQRALAKHEERTLTFEEEFELGMIMERFFHGQPSGVDHTVSSLGRGVLYRKEQGKPLIQPFDIPNFKLLVIDSGSAGNTAELVHQVKRNHHKDSIKQGIEDIGSVTQDIIRELQQPTFNPNNLGRLFSRNHELLQTIGVSTPTLDLLVNEALDKGALGAKLSGAGGGGIVFALVEEPNGIMEHIQSLGYSVFVAKPYLRKR